MSPYDPGRTPLVEFKGVTKIYPPRGSLFQRPRSVQPALNGIDLSIKKGDCFGLVGQSGSGKTTAGRLLVKLEEPTAGTVRFKGEAITSLRGKALRRYRSRVQMIFQDPYQSLNPHLSIAETVGEPLLVNRIGNPALRMDRVVHTLETVGLTPGKDFSRRYPHQLSGGQRQRVAIARAIVLEPEFIVADEPTSMLDATIAVQLFQLLLKIRETFDMTFLFITHNLAAARYLCNRVAVIHEGHIVEVDSAKNIIQNPQHPYTRRLIQAQPRFDAQF